MSAKPKPQPHFTYRVEVYSNGRWVELGRINRPGVLLPAWKGAHLGVWSGHVTRIGSPGGPRAKAQKP